MRKIAVTGGLAAGKSSVCRLLERHGAYVVSADEIVHRLLTLGSSVAQQVIDLIGSDIIHHNQLDRNKIAKTVFSHPEKLRALESILHPAVFDEIKKRYDAIKTNQSYQFFVAEVPLLFESGMHVFFDATVAVYAPEALAKARYPAPGEYQQRMKEQFSPEEKMAKADYLIINDGDLHQLEQQVLNLIQELHLQ